jgi:uncharacterized RDD family membrane protein YckC
LVLGILTGETAAPRIQLIRTATIVYGALLILHILYKTVSECSRLQGTPGKLLVGIRVTDLYGKRIAFPRSLARTWPIYGTAIFGFLAVVTELPELGKAFSVVVLISCVIAAVPPYKQGLHDMMARCLVIKRDVELKDVGEVFD